MNKGYLTKITELIQILNVLEQRYLPEIAELVQILNLLKQRILFRNNRAGLDSKCIET